jgi:hypothetical protein
VLFLNFRARRRSCCKRIADRNRSYTTNAVSLYLEYTFESRAYGQPKYSIELAATGHPKITIRISDRTKPLLTSQLGIAGGNPALFRTGKRAITCAGAFARSGAGVVILRRFLILSCR